MQDLLRYQFLISFNNIFYGEFFEFYIIGLKMAILDGNMLSE
jgi:hypothetical protein